MMNVASTTADAGYLQIERLLDAPINDVWELWTTKDGIESWWGPEGFAVRVRSLDLRPGGTLVYVMAAATGEMRDFMKQAGMPAETENRLTYDAIAAPNRLEYTDIVDFVPDVEPYSTKATLSLSEAAGQTRLELAFERMHDEMWTGRKRAGWESELDKLAALLAARA